ncbi:DsbA family oxidoreductase [Candidatus Thiodictyon syntrophicum]|jgi:predicted DsbA family dithiol-disulfide isomerase|uniref:Thioredoxin n=1 Tax=Candidatus Thiodictyon syntrophicum TaxID=1166950 RepID=A0A2K8U2G6_9GAMM|nr:DsbA family protein [Candidatus Thiodictyon syntrophicum]AUB79778.1 thioredoxin [Candidatus Thiodictyon syntrophicum]
MEIQQTLEILAFTDPVCTWCWGAEPVLRKLQVGYGDQVRIRPVMGGLVEDIRAFYDSANAIGGDPERSNAQIASHWLEASQRHGMPVRTEGFRLFTAEVVSTYPQNIAVKAAELTAPALGGSYLRRLREASAAEARETGRREVLIELAGDVGLDLATFIGHLTDGSAEHAFRADLELTRQFGVRGFPTFGLRFGERALVLRGYQNFQAMQAVIETLSEGALQWRAPMPDAAGLLGFLRTFGRAAPVELTTVFDLSPADLERLLAGLEAAGDIRRVAAGQGCFWEPMAAGPGCDSVTGLCAT